MTRLGKWNVSSYILSMGPKPSGTPKKTYSTIKYHLSNRVIKIYFWVACQPTKEGYSIVVMLPCE